MIACMAAAGTIARRWIDAQEWSLGRMHGLWARMGRGPAMAPHLATGLEGERAAYFELKRRGTQVVARRWTNARMRGDVDLIGWDGDWLCFVEVKTRTERDNTPAESAVDEDKRNMVRGLARAYLRTMPESERRTIPVRFDVVSVYAMQGITEIEVFPGAFGWQ
jgi:putative endonuclease